MLHYLQTPSVLELPRKIGSVLLEILNISPQEGELPDFLKKVSILPIFSKLLSDTDHLVNHPASSFPLTLKKMEKFERGDSSPSNMLPQISWCFVNLGHINLWL